MIPGNANPLLLKSAAAAGALQIERSLRFNSSDSAYLSRVVGTASNRKTWTWDAWVKRSTLGTIQMFFCGGVTANDTDQFVVYFRAEDTIRLTSGATIFRETTQVFRDPCSWYHFAIAVDTTLATANDRIKFYVNGVQVTTFNTTNNPTQNADTGINTAAFHTIGRNSLTPEYYFNGYLANIHFIDGQALTPSSFTETDATTGQLIPKTYSGSYGTNGFNLLFADNSSNTASTLGKDTSGLGNNFTPNILSVTAGAGNDSLVDSPTNYGTDTGVGGEVRGNYATLNPLGNSVSAAPYAPSNGNLQLTNPSGTSGGVVGTFEIPDGKWYFECTMTTRNVTGPAFGIAQNRVLSLDPGLDQSNIYGVYINPWLNAFSDGTQIWSAYYGDFGGITASDGDIFQIAIDTTNPSSVKCWLGRNNTYFGASNNVYGSPSAGTNNTFTITSGQKLFPYYGIRGPGDTGTLNANFGQRAFAYTAPSGFKALCTQNLPAPLVTKSNTVMDVLAYSGSGASRTFTGFGFGPDLVWIKQRSGANNHRLYDVVRGATKALYSNLTNSEGTDSTGLTSFTSDGFTLGDGDLVWNASGQTYVGWAWDAGTSTVSNPDGSITSQVRANATAGFSVVTWTPQATARTIGHGLGVAPEFIITKDRDVAGAPWFTYHKSLGAQKYLTLNDTSSVNTNSTVFTTAPTSTVFDQGTGFASPPYGRQVCYCFAPVVGYSSFGSFVGNGSSDGPMIYLGFRPRWFLYKATTSAQSWVLLDSARSSYNIVSNYLLPNVSDAEASVGIIDFLSNGVKIRFSGGSLNVASNTYVWAAFAEAPFNYSRAR